MAGKRAPRFADRFLASRKVINYSTNRRLDFVRDHTIDAQKYVFDHTATQYLDEMLRKFPYAIAMGQDFALAPFTKMWVELPRSLGDDSDNGGTSGLLFVGPHVHHVIEYPTGEIHLSPIAYSLNTPWSDSDREHFLRNQMLFERNRTVSENGQPLTPIALSLLTWGVGLDALAQTDRDHLRAQGKWCNQSADALEGILEKYADESDIPQDSDDAKLVRELDALFMHAQENAELMMFSLFNQHRLDLHLDPHIRKTHDDVEGLLKGAFERDSGTLARIVGLLLFLNRTRKISYQREVGPATSFIKGKKVTLQRHHVIEFNIDPGPLLKKMYADVKLRRMPQHDVPGHFCHDLVARLHCYRTDGDKPYYYHNWQELPDSDPRMRRAPDGKALTFYCATCHGWKWWRKDHKRGDPALGVSSSEYRVKK